MSGVRVLVGSIRGNSSGCGIWNRPSPIRTRSSPESRTRPSFAPWMAGRIGRNSPACETTGRGVSGSPAQVAWACTPSCSTPSHREGTLSLRRRDGGWVIYCRWEKPVVRESPRESARFTESDFKIPPMLVGDSLHLACRPPATKPVGASPREAAGFGTDFVTA